MILVLFIIEIIILVFVDRILYGTYITPISVLSVPYLLIVLLAIFIAPKFGFVDFYFPSLWVWIIGLPLFWIPGVLLATVVLRKTNINNYPYFSNKYIGLDRVIIFTAYLLIIIISFGFFRSIRNGSPGSESFGEAFGTGISGHCLLISKLFFVFLIIDFKKKYLLPIVILILFNLVYGSKGSLLIQLFAGIIILILLKRIHLNFRLIILLIFCGAIIFYLVYRISLGTQMTSSFVVIHFIKYVFSGVLGLSEYIAKSGESGIDPTLLINPLVNLYNKFSQIRLQSTYSNISTYIGLDAYPNVKTFFGTIYIYGGALWGSIFVFIFGFITYFFLIIIIKTGDIIFLILYSLFITALLFGWFDIYFNNLVFYELPTFGVILSLLINSISRKKMLEVE